jgi:hypothetical protein
MSHMKIPYVHNQYENHVQISCASYKAGDFSSETKNRDLLWNKFPMAFPESLRPRVNLPSDPVLPWYMLLRQRH